MPSADGIAGDSTQQHYRQKIDHQQLVEIGAQMKATVEYQGEAAGYAEQNVNEAPSGKLAHPGPGQPFAQGHQ